MSREIFRELLSANLFVTGLLLTLASFLIFYGSVFMITFTNLGKKLAFLVTMTGIFAWSTIGSLLFVLYAPRGPRQASIEGLNAFEVRIVPLTYMLVSLIVFIGFLFALNQYEETQERA